MSRYFTLPRAKVRAEADADWWVAERPPALTVCDHEAVDTGLVDAQGNAIMRAPNPCGFGKDDEW